MRDPKFINLPDDKKLLFLYDWSELLAKSVQSLQAQIHALHERLTEVESKADKNA